MHYPDIFYFGFIETNMILLILAYFLKNLIGNVTYKNIGIDRCMTPVFALFSYDINQVTTLFIMVL